MVTRDYANIKAITDPASMATRFDKMLNNVANMLAKAPIYTTWIRFQIGKKQPLTFNTASTNKKQNLIADLEVEKQGAGVCNDFTINVYYDPFDYGQNPTDQIELLDDLIAYVMSFDISDDTSENNLDSLRGYIQYGYNYSDDTTLVSPKYQFMLTGAETRVTAKNGITRYTFTGTSDLAIDCDFNVTFPEFSNVSLLDVITTVLYCYYGDSENPPSSSHLLDNITYVENDFKYKIDISDSLYADSPTIESIEASAAISPWSYCKNLLTGKISKSDEESEDYKNLDTLKENEKPQYILYMTDEAGAKCIHLNYISPKKEGNTKLDFEFTWSLQAKNLVEDWNPQVDLQLYLIRKAQAIRKARLAAINPDTGTTIYDSLQNIDSSAIYNIATNAKNGTFELGDNPIANFLELLLNNSGTVKVAGAVGTSIMNSLKGIDLAAIQAYIKAATPNTQIKDEMYDAELTIVGIPSDIPLGCEIKIKPRINQAVSRTAGIYMVKGCTDRIDTSGKFSSTLKLLRLKSLDE